MYKIIVSNAVSIQTTNRELERRKMCRNKSTAVRYIIKIITSLLIDNKQIIFVI